MLRTHTIKQYLFGALRLSVDPCTECSQPGFYLTSVNSFSWHKERELLDDVCLCFVLYYINTKSNTDSLTFWGMNSFLLFSPSLYITLGSWLYYCLFWNWNGQICILCLFALQVYLFPVWINLQFVDSSFKNELTLGMVGPPTFE